MDQIPSLVSTFAFFCFIFASYDWSIVYGNSEVDILSAFSSQLQDPNNVFTSWDGSLRSPCTWFHITCNKANSVVQIDLKNLNLSGPLIPELGQLVNLHYMDISGNSIIRIIPKEFGNLKNLVVLDLSRNNLHGRIPNTLGKLQHLRFLRLNNNALSGAIPYSLTTLHALHVLDLSSNRLSGYVPTNGSFSHFTHASFANNPKLIFHAAPPSPAPPN
nr:brassinosteroid insensitive 1-associated receptor kinase 1-like [Tanacetum cinerariifolium]